MKIFIAAFFCILATSLVEAKDIELKQSIRITDQGFDQELIDFFPLGAGDFWLVAKESEIGKMNERYKVKIAKVTGGKIINEIPLFSAIGTTKILAVEKNESSIIAVILENNTQISIYEVRDGESSPHIYTPKFSVKNGYIQSADLSDENTGQVYFSYVDTGIVKLALVDYLKDKVIWEKALLSAEGTLGSVMNISNIKHAIFLAGVANVNGKFKGWLGKVDDTGSLIWQKLMAMENAVLLPSLSESQPPLVGLNNRNENQLSVTTIDEVINGKIKRVPFKVSGYTTSLPKVYHVCDENYFLIAKKSQDSGVSLNFSISKYTGKQDLKSVSVGFLKADNGTFVNFIAKLIDKLYLGDTYIYMDSNRLLRSGIEINLLNNLSSCGL